MIILIKRIDILLLWHICCALVGDNMKKLFGLLTVLFLVVGCSGGLYEYRSVSPEKNIEPHVLVRPVYIDNTFNDVELATINQVVKEWNYVLNGYVVWKIELTAIDHTNEKATKYLIKQMSQNHEGIMVLGMNHDDDLVSDTIDEEDSVLAFVNGLGERGQVMVVLRDRIGHKNLHKILLHEFGHAMGGEHVNTDSLMFPIYSRRQFDCVDKITAAQAATFFNLKLEYLNFCKTPNF